MAQAIVEAVMGDDDNFSDDDSSENITGLRHLSYTESITMDMLNESTSIDEKERILHRTATDVSSIGILYTRGAVFCLIKLFLKPCVINISRQPNC